MAPIDFIFTLLIAIPALYGLWRGVVRMVLSALAIFLGLLFARQYAGPLAQWLRDWAHIGSVSGVAAFILCFLLVAFVFTMVGRLIRKGLVGVNLGCLDRLLGAALGGLVGLGLSFVLVFLIFTYLSEPEEYLRDSRLAPSVVRAGTFFLLLIPPWMEEEVQEEYRRLERLIGKEKEGETVTPRPYSGKENRSGSPSVLDQRAILAVSSTTSARYIAS